MSGVVKSSREASATGSEAAVPFIHAQTPVAKRVSTFDRASTPLGPIQACFEGEIHQVLHNLVTNALDALRGIGGRLLLRGRDGTDWRTGQAGMVLTVADNGSGMSEETRKKIFDAFFTTKGIGGTGLGLWVNKEIIGRHAGRVHLRSSQQGLTRGTVFTIFLPYDAVERN